MDGDGARSKRRLGAMLSVLPIGGEASCSNKANCSNHAGAGCRVSRGGNRISLRKAKLVGLKDDSVTLELQPIISSTLELFSKREKDRGIECDPMLTRSPTALQECDISKAVRE